MSATATPTTMPTVTRRHVDSGTWLYLVDGISRYTVTRLYNHLPWAVRDDQGWLLQDFRSISDADSFIRTRHSATKGVKV